VSKRQAPILLDCAFEEKREQLLFGFSDPKSERFIKDEPERKEAAENRDECYEIEMNSSSVRDQGGPPSLDEGQYHASLGPSKAAACGQTPVPAYPLVNHLENFMA
jgi:hypothetical protein